MKKALTILITGGIGSGKSVLSRYLESRGVPVYDSDSRAKALYDSEMGEAVESLFGVCLRDGNGRFDRKALASLVFSDSRKLVVRLCRRQAFCVHGIRDCIGQAPFCRVL